MNGKKFRALRKELRLNQTRFAEIMGVCLQTISYWEIGKTQAPRSALILATLMVEDPLLERRVLAMQDFK